MHYRHITSRFRLRVTPPFVVQVARHASLELRSILPAGVPPWLLLVLERQEGINKANTRLNAINIAGEHPFTAPALRCSRALSLSAPFLSECALFI